MLKLAQNLKTKIENNKDFFYLIGFGLIYLVWTYGNFVRQGSFPSLPTQQLDNSWIIGLNWASFLNLRWLGNSVVFTYGPLYYLNGLLMPQFHSDSLTILTNIGLNLFYTGCFTYIYSLFAKLRFENKNRWIAVIVVLMLFFQKPDINLVPLFVIFIFLPIIFAEKNEKTNFERYIRYGIIALLLAVIPFVKFTHVYESFLLIIMMTSFLIYRRKYLDAALLGILFIIFTILVWVWATGESIFSLFPYLASRFSISSGYTEAMLTDFNSADMASFQVFTLALLFLTALTIIFTYLFFTKRWVWATAWLLPMVPLFISFKGAFVRADYGHATIFISQIFLCALYYFYLLELMSVNTRDEESNLSSWRQPAARVFTPLLVLMVLSTFYYLGGRLLVGNQFLTAPEFSSESTYSQEKDQEILKKIYNLDPKFLSQIDTRKTIDIIPWDIALLYGHNLRWTPRPVIQSYASYTATLDDLDASFFKQPNSPKQLIYSPNSMDNRYSIFDTPHTFRVLLDNYRFTPGMQSGIYTLLKKKEKPLSRDLVLMSEKEYNLKQPISIPTIQNAHIFMTAEIEPTLIGQFFNIVYKPTISHVEIELNTGEKIKYRLIRSTAKNGLFVSKYIKNLTDVESVFGETYTQNIIAVRFIGDAWLYNNNINIHFYKIPFDN